MASPLSGFLLEKSALSPLLWNADCITYTFSYLLFRPMSRLCWSDHQHTNTLAILMTVAVAHVLLCERASYPHYFSFPELCWRFFRNWESWIGIFVRIVLCLQINSGKTDLLRRLNPYTHRCCGFGVWFKSWSPPPLPWWAPVTF